jgi:hypothetical protein
MKFQKRHVKMDENDLSRAQSYEKLDLDTVGRKNVNSGLDAMIPRLTPVRKFSSSICDRTGEKAGAPCQTFRPSPSS